MDEVTSEFDQYEYAKALAKAESFFWDFCDNYVEAAKSRRYGDFGHAAAASASTAMRTALSVMLRLLAPYLAFTSEEVWSWWQEGSIHCAGWPTRAEILAVSGEDEDAQKASVYLSVALGAIRKAKTEGQVSVGTPVSSVRFVESAPAVAALRLVERDLKAAARTEELQLIASEDTGAFGASMTPKPAEMARRLEGRYLANESSFDRPSRRLAPPEAGQDDTATSEAEPQRAVLFGGLRRSLAR